MLGFTEKADWRISGYRGKRVEGGMTGRLYTPFPLRIKQAFIKAIIASLCVFVIPAILVPSAIYENEIFNEIVTIIIAAVWILSLPYFLLLDPGKSIKMTKDTFQIGFRRFHLGEMSAFMTQAINHKSPHIHRLTFNYGTKEKTIKINNKSSDQMRIALELNRIKEELQSVAIKPASSSVGALEARSASF